ncbi:hypothetical protein MPNT_200056 [Candidatus Methylacidithermus pantelleriae]|uniref:Uncharacterized protein n=1 Tax=Candidatus Methylacidithermus pantelleriae TaxID=2744239 RepID=A0A8J2FS87_9BACT|nr:hypothetical protein MPNT_200056 [Candidatus Methylacidithermus pantelleriae]
MDIWRQWLATGWGRSSRYELCLLKTGHFGGRLRGRRGTFEKNAVTIVSNLFVQRRAFMEAPMEGMG